MTPTIAYDQHITNLIDELSATGHVSHRSYAKKSVTFHHNGGKLSHQGVLAVWKYRPASAHFDSDAKGAIAQYVKVNEYAWAVANTRGNQETISIEMCNATLSPHWEVAEVTWKSAARLAGWLFAKVIKAKPSKDNVFFHHHWYSTSCAGPYMDSVYNQLLAEVQLWYNHFIGGGIQKPAVGESALQHLQEILEVPKTNKWDQATEARALLMRNAARAKSGYPNNTGILSDVKTVQRVVDTNADGAWGKNSQAKLVAWVKSVQTFLKLKNDGKWGPGTDEAYLRFRKSHR